MPAVTLAPYQAYLATGSVTRPPFVANRSAGKFSANWRFKGRRGSKSWKRRKGKESVTGRKKEGSELRIGKLKGT